MRLLIVCSSILALALVLAGCTVQSENPSVGDATKAYVAPAICESAQRCTGTGIFMTVYPGGLADCEQKTYDHVSDKTRVSSCTNDEYKTCAADYRVAPCTTDVKTGFLPAIPASCSKC